MGWKGRARMHYVAVARVRSLWRIRSRVGTEKDFVWERNEMEGKIKGRAK